MSPPAPPLDDDDLLSETLLRLPPHPSSLPRASAVSKRWRNLASDPAFSHRFRRHHRRNVPLLGCFMPDGREIRFDSTLDPPNSVPRARFSFPMGARDCDFSFVGCRHGFVLMFLASQGTLKLLVWDPVNGHEHHIAIPPGFGAKSLINGAVYRASLALGDINHFQVVLVSTDIKHRVIACVYSSVTGAWGNLITTISNHSLGMIDPSKPAVLVGNSLYMLLLGKPSGIIEFDVDRQSLAVIPLPVRLDPEFSRYYSVVRAEGGGLGLLFVSKLDCSGQLWKWKTDCHGVASWVLGRTIALDSLLSLDFQNNQGIHIPGFAEENNVVFLWTFVGVFMVQLDSLQFKKLSKINLLHWHPFECVYAAGI